MLVTQGTGTLFFGDRCAAHGARGLVGGTLPRREFVPYPLFDTNSALRDLREVSSPRRRSLGQRQPMGHRPATCRAAVGRNQQMLVHGVIHPPVAGR